jgi:hypothetical protein
MAELPQAENDGDCQWEGCSKEGVTFVVPDGQKDYHENGLVVCMRHRDLVLLADWHEPKMLSVEEAVAYLQAAGYHPVVDQEDHLWPQGEEFN